MFHYTKPWHIIQFTLTSINSIRETCAAICSYLVYISHSFLIVVSNFEFLSDSERHRKLPRVGTTLSTSLLFHLSLGKETVTLSRGNRLEHTNIG